MIVIICQFSSKAARDFEYVSPISMGFLSYFKNQNYREKLKTHSLECFRIYMCKKLYIWLLHRHVTGSQIHAGCMGAGIQSNPLLRAGSVLRLKYRFLRVLKNSRCEDFLGYLGNFFTALVSCPVTVKNCFPYVKSEPPILVHVCCLLSSWQASL